MRTPPHSIEAEQAVLGGLLWENPALERVVDLVTPGDFYLAEHRVIYKGICDLADQGVSFDEVTLGEHLRRASDSDSSPSVFEYLRELSVNTPSTANITVYAMTIRERSLLRRVIALAEEIEQSASHTDGRSAQQLIEEAELQIATIRSQAPKGGRPVPVAELLSNTQEKIQTLAQSGLDISGLSTGFEDLDLKTNGLQPADLVIVAGRPSMGKTSFAMNLVENAVLSTDKAVLVYSLEMPGESLILRMISSLGRIDQTTVRNGKLNDGDWIKLGGAVSQLSDRKLFIDDTSGLSPSEMRTRARRIKRMHGDLALIVVDYLQLMQIPGARGSNRTNEISQISRSLKALAKEFNCPVVALSQLNRSLEDRKNKRPINSDLRESGAIEQDADVIMFVYRDEVYHPDSRFKGTAEIIIGKRRDGPTGFSRLAFIDRLTRFENLDPDSHDFTPEELGVERVEKHPRVGRVVASAVATLDKFKRIPSGKKRPEG